MPFWRPSRSSSACCRRSPTPTLCQSRQRRQQVIPEPQPIPPRQQLPGRARAQHEQDPRQRREIGRSRPTTLRLGPISRKQRCDFGPEPVGEKRSPHLISTRQTRFCQRLLFHHGHRKFFGSMYCEPGAHRLGKLLRRKENQCIRQFEG